VTWPPSSGQDRVGGQRGSGDRLNEVRQRLQQRYGGGPSPPSSEVEQPEQVSPGAAAPGVAPGASAPHAEQEPAGWDGPTGGVQGGPAGGAHEPAGSCPAGGAGAPSGGGRVPSLPSELHRRLLLLLYSNSKPTTDGLRLSFWPQVELAARLKRDVRTVQRLVDDLREPGRDPRNPYAEDRGLRLGLVKVRPRQRDAVQDRARGTEGGRLFGVNEYLLLVPWEVIAALPATGRKRPGRTDPTSRFRRSHRPDTKRKPVSAGRTDPTSTFVSGQKPYGEPPSAEGEEVSSTVSGPAGPITPNPREDDERWGSSSRGRPATTARRRSNTRSTGPSYRGKHLLGSERSFHAAVDQLDADTVPATYVAKVIAGALEDPATGDPTDLADALGGVRGQLGAVEILAVHRTRPTRRSA